MAGAFGPQRKFKFRVQLRAASSKKPRRVTLVAQRRILSKGKVVTSGAAVQVGKTGQMNALIAKPKLKQQGGKIRGIKSSNVKVGGKWKRTTQAGG